MHTDHVDISQTFTQGELIDGDGQNGKVYISAPTDYPEDPAYCYLLKCLNENPVNRATGQP